MEFLLRPKIFDEESLVGFIERIAFHNRYKNSLWIYNLLMSSTRDLQNNLFSIKDTDILEQLTHQPSELLYSRSYDKRNRDEEINNRYILKNNIKFCPQCLNKKGIHKYIWGFHPVCICLEHQQILKDHCPKCYKNISLYELLQLGYCKYCSEQFSMSSNNNCNLFPTYVESQLQIQHYFLGGNPVLKDMQVIDSKNFFRLAELSFHILEGLQSFIDDQPTFIYTFSNKRNGNISNLKNLVSWGNFFWMYQDFPNHYYQVLNQFVKKKKETIYEQKAKYEKGLFGEEFSIIRDAYEQFWLQELDAGIVRKDLSVFKNNTELLKQRGSLRREEVKNEVGMCYEKMDQLHKTGRLEIKSNSLGEQRRYIVNRDSLKNLIEDRNGYIYKHEAASILGITKESIVHLIKEGIIKELATPYGIHKMIKKSEVEELLLECSGTYQRSFRGISFHDALIKYSVNGLKIVDLIRFTRSGLIYPRRRCPIGTLAEVLYSEYELELCTSKLKKERQEIKGYYLSEVMKILHIGEKKLKWLLQDKGIIPDQTVILKDGRKRYLFTKVKIEEIRSALR